MRETKADRHALLCARLAERGFTVREVTDLLRLERTLQRWAELECGDSNARGSWAIERDETTGIPYMMRTIYPDGPHGKDRIVRTRIADREAGALKRLARLMESHPEYVSHHQTDPRGCALYICARADVAGKDRLDSCYTRGVAVCV